MKHSKPITALLLLIVGLIYMIDWIVFSTKPENSAMSWVEFQAKYIDRFPEGVRWFFEGQLSTVVALLILGVAGLLFLNLKGRGYLFLGIFSMVLAGWQLFSLM